MSAAPTDGTVFLAYDAYGEYQIARMDEGIFRSWETGKRLDLDAWMPLPEPYSREVHMTDEIDAFLANEGDLNCPACDGGIERNAVGELECDMCGRKWTASEVVERNQRRMS